MQLPVFFGGIVLFHLIGAEDGRKKLVPWRRWLLGGSIVGTASLAYSPLAQEPIAFGMVLLGFATHLGCSPNNILVNRWIRYLGKISFSCYICHFFVLHELGHRLDGWSFAGLDPGLGNALNYGWLLVVSLLVSSFLATVSYLLIEKPGIRLGNSLVAKMETKATASQSSS
jgi:peptidoglycan/LPS O-acetylase OafA/YrhL